MEVTQQEGQLLQIDHTSAFVVDRVEIVLRYDLTTMQNSVLCLILCMRT